MSSATRPTTSSHVGTSSSSSIPTPTARRSTTRKPIVRFGGILLFGFGFLCGRMSYMIPMAQLMNEIQHDQQQRTDTTTTATTRKENSITSNSSKIILSAPNHSDMVNICQSFLLVGPKMNSNRTDSLNSMTSSSGHPPTKVRINTEEQDIEEKEKEEDDDDDENNNPDILHFHPLCRHLVMGSHHTEHRRRRQGSASVPSAMSLWIQHIDQILNVSRLPQDRTFHEQSITIQLLDLITPRLPLSVKSMVRDWKSVDDILDKLYHRYMYLQKELQQQQHQPQQQQRDSSPSSSPQPIPDPVTILIMGGSVTMGVNCITGIPKVTEKACSWPSRLEKTINRFVLGRNTTTTQKLVTVSTVASGGMNSKIGADILKYDLLQQPQPSDIIINAYSTNDMHILSVEEAIRKNVTLEDLVMDMIQEFIRVVWSPSRNQYTNQCHRPPTATTTTSSYLPQQQQQDQKSSSASSLSLPSPRRPLIIHWNDYLGNEQNEIHATMALSRGAAMLSSYYGIASVSYPDVVRDLVYGDTREDWFSPGGWYRRRRHNYHHKEKKDDYGNNNNNESHDYQREIHPGSMAHRTMAYVMMYNLLHLITTRCNMMEYGNVHGSQQVARGGKEYLEKYYPSSFALRNNSSNNNNVPEEVDRSQGQKPHPVPMYSLPPLLTKELNLQHVSTLWQKEDVQMREMLLLGRRIASNDDDNNGGGSPDGATATSQGSCYTSRRRCPFAWVSGLIPSQSTPEWVHSYFANVTKEQTNWNVEGGRKTGFVPTYGIDPIDNRIHWEFVSAPQPITSITLFLMRSYGPKWENSMVQLKLWYHPSSSSSSSSISIVKEFVGYHGKNTSETYSETISLLPTPLSTGDTLNVQLTLIRGNSFKITGFIVCS